MEKRFPAGDDRQKEEKATKRAESSNPTRPIPLVSCGRSLKTLPGAKRSNRLPLLTLGRIQHFLTELPINADAGEREALPDLGSKWLGSINYARSRSGGGEQNADGSSRRAPKS